MIYQLSPFAGQRHYVLAVDGSCINNPGPGGWGTLRQLVEADGTVSAQHPFAGSLAETTNIRAEMTAAIKGLSKLDIPDTPALIISDSEVVVKGATIWMPGWKERNWKNSDGKPVKNMELWQEIDALMQGRQIEWLWVRGHAGHPLNEMVDTLAKSAARRVYAKPGHGLKDMHHAWFLGLDALPARAA